VLIVLDRAKSSILLNGNFRKFFFGKGGILRFQTGIPGGSGETVDAPDPVVPQSMTMQISRPQDNISSCNW